VQVNIGAAKSQFAKLIEAALAGEDVITAKRGKPVARLVAINPRPYRLGGLEGQVPLPPDGFFDPLGEKALRDWE